MKHSFLKWVCMIVTLALLVPSCIPTVEENLRIGSLPEGTPITLRLDFGASDLMEVKVSTKAEATAADEARIHDLYVFIFCDGEGDGHVKNGQKIYGRYFSYEHLAASLSALDNSPNEGWWVENKTIDNVVPAVTTTRGAVKISTRVCSEAKLVVIANIDNGICKLGDKEDILEYLNGIRNYDDLRKTQVKLTQDVVNRKDLFLMLGFPENNDGTPKNVNTGEMVWGSTTPSTSYNSDYRVYLRPVDAKVKFKVRINDPSNPIPFISAAKAVYWEVCNTPDRCYLFSDYAPKDTPVGTPPENTVFFTSEQAYFEGTEGDWYVFSFYILESRFGPKAHADRYHQRELKSKTPLDKTGYGGDPAQHYVENGEWIYASPNAPYVKFDMILTLTPEGVQALGGNVNHALTSDTIYSVHLGDFTNSELRFDDYNTLRGCCYTYEITIANAGSIYAEVILDQENQPGQEGYLLLTDDEIVNADSHYEYHAITFTYDAETSPEKFSWYVKTPFTSQVGGGPQKGKKTVGGVDYPLYDPHDTDGTLLDYRWVKFSINETDPSAGYSTHRVAYPGDDAYDKSWGDGEHGGPWDDTPHPFLMDISQLIQFIFQETDKRKDWETEHAAWVAGGSVGDEPVDESAFRLDTDSGEMVIRATIFIDEYYYETDPRDESVNPQVDPNLWRKFVNAQPREMHILSKTVQSRDRMSDVIESSHSVIQQSIQTIYNVYEPSLRSIWGCEHLDEIKYTTTDGKPLEDAQENAAGNWKYWPDDCPEVLKPNEKDRAGANSDIGKANGRLNSAYIWGLYTAQNNSGVFTVDGEGKGVREWETFLTYEVDNRIPEVKENYRGMAWSCLTRNRDNDGNGRIDENEVRWYMAASEQLAGLWVGTESLSTSARLYQPASGQWRAHVVSSTAKLVAWSEEGAGATDIANDWKPNSPYYTWADEAAATVGESVRCIRNIGTYDDPVKGLTDITKAPVTELPDAYFTLERHSGRAVNDFDCSKRGGEDKEDYFIFYFDRLSTKSIREYSPGELPYHDQMSMNNRVYKMMVTQPLNRDVSHNKFKVGEENMDEEALAASSSYVLWKDINNNVTQAGTNKYCPPGYRFPNHTEWLLMSLYLPEKYLKRDSTGTIYSNTGGKATVMPSRTYYDRGYYGSLRDAAWATEYNKVGWIFSDKMHCSESTLPVTHSRCVKDEDQTGVISGKMAIEGGEIYPGDVIPIDFKFSSTATAFSEATLTLWYTKNGFRTPYDLTAQLKVPNGLLYNGVQYIKMPTLAELGLDPATFSEAAMSLEVALNNLSNRPGGHELDVTMEHPLQGDCAINDATDGEVFPHDKNKITLHLSTNAHAQALSNVSLYLCYDDRRIPISIPALGSDVRAYNQTNLEIDIPTLAQLSGLSESALIDGKDAHLEATVQTKTSNTETLSKTVSSANFTLSHPIVANTYTIDSAEDKIYPGDSNTISLEFASRGHTPRNLSTVTVQLYDTDGVTPMGDPIVSASGIAAALFSSSSSVAIPTLAALGLDVSDLDPGTDYFLRAIVTNVDGLSRTIDKTLTLSNPISGSFSVPAGYVFAADYNTLNFNVSSQAKTSTLTAVSFKLTYTGIDGNTHNVTSGFSSLPSPTGKTYSGNQTISFPVLTQNPNTDAADSSLPITLIATFTANGGITKDITCDIPVRAHITNSDSDLTILKGADIPLNVRLGAASTFSITSAKLQWRQHNGSSWTSWNNETLDESDADQDINTTDLTGFTNFTTTLSSMSEQKLEYKLALICSDGVFMTTPVGSVTVYDYGYEPYTDPTRLTVPFVHAANNIHFSNGDFIEASMVKTTNTTVNSEALGFGVGTCTVVDGVPDILSGAQDAFHWAQQQGTGTVDNCKNGYTVHAVYRVQENPQVLMFDGYHPDWVNKKFQFNLANTLVVRIDQYGLHFNNPYPAAGKTADDPVSLGNTLDGHITNILTTDYTGTTFLMIGAAKGDNRKNVRSTAHYDYIHVVRQPLWTTP